VDRSTRDSWLLETAEFTMQRMDFAAECYSMASVTRENLVSLGCPGPLIDGLISAKGHYSPDIVTYRETVRSLLEDIVNGEYSTNDLELLPREEEKKDEPGQGEIVLDTIQGNEEEETGITEAHLRELLEGKIELAGLDPILEDLLDTGEIYSPSEGVFKSI